MNFIEATKAGFENYINFSTRASRSEYWWFTLFLILASIVLTIVDVYTGTYDDATGSGLLSTGFSFATLVPSLSISARRLHDVGRSGWWILIAFTIIGIFLLLYWYIKKGDENENEYGHNPLHEVESMSRVFD